MSSFCLFWVDVSSLIPIEEFRRLAVCVREAPLSVPVAHAVPAGGSPRRGLVGWTRQRRFDGISFEPRKLPENAARTSSLLVGSRDGAWGLALVSIPCHIEPDMRFSLTPYTGEFFTAVSGSIPLLLPSWRLGATRLSLAPLSGLTCRCCKFHFMLRAAALLPFLRDLRQRFDTSSHPTASVACYPAS
jgi:hypothetical protein